MANRIPKDTQVIKATCKIETNAPKVLWCTKPEDRENWRGIGADGKWWYVFSSHLRNSDIYDIECFKSWDEAYEKGAIA